MYVPVNIPASSASFGPRSKENYADDSSYNYRCTADHKSNQRRTGFPDNALEVRLKQ